MREVGCSLNFRRRDGVMDERTQCVYAHLHRVDGLQVERVARLDALASPHGLHDAIAAEIAREHCAAASAVASHEDHHVAKLPAVLRVATKVGAVRPAILRRRILDAHDPAVESAEDFDKQQLATAGRRG